MKLEITSSKIKEINLLTLFLFGVFFTSVIFAINIRLFNTFGIWTGMLTSILLVIAAFYTSSQSRSYRRIIAWGLLATIITAVIVMTVGVHFATSKFSI